MMYTTSTTFALDVLERHMRENTDWARALLAGLHRDFPQPDSTDTKKS